MDRPEESFRTLPKKLQLLIVVLSAFATAVIGWSAWNSSINTWVVLALLTILTVPFSIYIPEAEWVVPLGEMYLMAIAIMYGTSACVVATALYTAAVCSSVTRKSAKTFMLVFVFAVNVCGAFLYSSGYRLIGPANGVGALMLTAVVIFLISFLFTSFAAATAVCWKRGNGVAKYWRTTYLPLAMNSFVSAACAALISLFMPLDKRVPLMFIPVIAAVWLWTRAHRNRIMISEPARSGSAFGSQM